MNNDINNINKAVISDIRLEDIPEIELYVDQIITLLNKNEADEEKRLTKSMINNYSKAKIIEKIKGRKYSQAHVIVIAIINRLKQTLTINEIKTLMDRAATAIVDEAGEYNLKALKEIYSSYLKIYSGSQSSYNEISRGLDAAKSRLSKEGCLMVEALCWSALSQGFQVMVKNMVKE